VNITTVKSVGGMALGTSVNVDCIDNVLNVRMDIVTLSVSPVVVVLAQSLSKMKLKCQTTRVLSVAVTLILGMVLILEVILCTSFEIKYDCNLLLINC
jgi:hypothetical protein